MDFGKIKRKLKASVLKLPHIKAKRKKYGEYMKSRYDYDLGSPTIMCSACIGGMISHELGLQFMSPTINLWMMPSDLVKLVSNPDKYMNAEFEEISDSGYSYPVGRLLDITIYFNHYNSFEEAVRIWMRRKKRIDWDNLYIITDDKNLTDVEIETLKNVKCKRLVIFTKDERKDECFFKYECYENAPEVGFYSARDLRGFAPYEREFDYCRWFLGDKDYRMKIKF